MKPWILPGVAGFCFGAVAVLAVDALRTGDAERRHEARVAELETALSRALQDREETAARLDSLREQAPPPATAATPRPETSAATLALGEPPAAPDPQAQRLAFIERATQRLIDRWAARLKLTPDQVERLRQLVGARLQDPDFDPRNWASLESDLMQVLTTEQKAAHAKIEERETKARQELRVHTEMARVQGLFDLSESQKDQIFQRFAALETAPAAPSAPGTSRSDERLARNQARLDAVSDILTAEQLQQYADALENSWEGRFRGR